MGFAQFGTLIDLKGLPELRGITMARRWRAADRRGGDPPRDRALARRCGRSSGPRPARGAGRERARPEPGHDRRQPRFAEPHSDPATFLLACDATRRAGRRRTGAGSCAIGDVRPRSARCTAREADEILVAIDVPAAARRRGTRVREARRSSSDRRRRSRSALRVDGRRDRRGARSPIGSMTDVPAARRGRRRGARRRGGDRDGPRRRIADAPRDAFDDLDAVGGPRRLGRLQAPPRGRAARPGDARGAAQEALARA